MLTISLGVMFGATLSPTGKYKFKSIEAASETNLPIQTSTHFTLYTIMSRENNKRPLCDTWTFQADTGDESMAWVALLRSAIGPPAGEDDKKSVLVIINPMSGKRKSQKLFETVVKPILDIGGTRYTLMTTESAEHAPELMETGDLSQYSMIATIGGDGIMHDILNGLLQRSDWPKYKSLPLAVIPAGSGNGLAKSLDCIWPEQAAVAVVKGRSRPLDVMNVTLASGQNQYCFLSMTWGLVADIDIESERMRWAGSTRFDLYGTVRLMNLRYYGGRLHYLPAGDNIDDKEGEEAVGDEIQEASAVSKPKIGGSNNSSIANMMERSNQGVDDAWGLPPPSFSSPLVRQSPKILSSTTHLAPFIQPAVTLHPTLTAGIQLPIIGGSLPPRWKTIEGPFAQVTATNVAWLASDFLACQRARISDGTIDLVFSRVVSKWQIIPYVANSTKDNYMNRDGIEHVKVRAFILEPTGLRTTSKGAAHLQAVQRPGHHDYVSKRKHRKSVPFFGSLRSKQSLGKASPQPPVPVRVRSQAYSEYHRQTIGRSTDVSKDVRVPSQAVFSLRTQTDLAEDKQKAVSSSSFVTEGASPAMPPTNGAPQSPITHTPIRDIGEDGKVKEDEAGCCRLVGKHGIIDLDGEVAELGPIKVECLANLMMIVCPPWLNESQTSGLANGGLGNKGRAEPIMGSLSREGSVLSFNNI